MCGESWHLVDLIQAYELVRVAEGLSTAHLGRLDVPATARCELLSHHM